MTTYRSKPTRVDAMRWDGRNTEAVLRWIRGRTPGEVVFGVGCLMGHSDADTKPRLMIGPFDVAETIDAGDWIVVDGSGLYEAVPDEIFRRRFVQDGDGDAA